MKFTIYDLRFTILTLLVCLALPARADLVATVTPGYTLSPGEAPTTDTLNFLGMPTVTISGTISGSTGLTPGSVNGALLSDTLPDGISLSWNSASPRQLQVKPQGVSTNHLNTNDWQWPLVQGNSAQLVQLAVNPLELFTNASGLSVAFDTNFLGTNILGLTKAGPTNTFTIIRTNGSPTNVIFGPEFTVAADTNTIGGISYTGLTFHLSEFMSAEVPLTNNTAMFVSASHGFTNLPTRVRWVVVCKTAELGYNPGDECDSIALAVSGDPTRHPVPGTDRTNVFWSLSTTANTVQLPNKTNPASPQSLTAAAGIVSNFKLKCYASP